MRALADKPPIGGLRAGAKGSRPYNAASPGDWCIGNTVVSKTATRGSTPRSPARPRAISAVIFDLDGVLMDSEQLWNAAKQELVRQAGGHWHEGAPRDMMGMSSREWSEYLRDRLGVARSLEEINRDVLARMRRLYRTSVPLIAGAERAVRALQARWPLGLASSSNREIIELALAAAGLADAFAVSVSSEEVPRGKPAPDVYLETARRLGVPAAACVAIEDSSNGLRSAAAAGLAVIAVPHPTYPPAPDAIKSARLVLPGLAELTADKVAALDAA
jgi:HAD superfamily hydrolase (TIGR01509 family)